MVFISRIVCSSKPAPKIRRFLWKGFLDTYEIEVKSGVGGHGFPRYGGLGGQGGNIYLKTKEDLDLRQMARKNKNQLIKAGNGCNSTKKGIIGAPGDDVYIDVPVGISVYTKNGILKGELDEPDKELLVVPGGLGGNPSNGYNGQKGNLVQLVLDLKLVADVALVGFPNAGKSTLLRTVSRAKPKVANYPFTTMKPNLGIMEYEDKRVIKMADLPGLIEGAHANIGMGHKFLKHTERSKIILYLVDIQGFQLSLRHPFRNCLDTVVLLNKEMELYKPDLLDRPAILMVNKMDTPNSNKILEEIRPSLVDLESYFPKSPAMIRPDRVLKFEEIITTSLLTCNINERTRIMNIIRQVIDDVERKKLEEQDVELDFRGKLMARNKQIAQNLA